MRCHPSGMCHLRPAANMVTDKPAAHEKGGRARILIHFWGSRFHLPQPHAPCPGSSRANTAAPRAPGLPHTAPAAKTLHVKRYRVIPLRFPVSCRATQQVAHHQDADVAAAAMAGGTARCYMLTWPWSTSKMKLGQLSPCGSSNPCEWK